MYTKEPNEKRTATPILIYGVAVVSILLNIIIGLNPSLVLDIIK